MMSLNPYKLKNAAKKGDKRALRASQLLETPDKLIGLILLGNNLVNIAATTIATVLFQNLYGDLGLIIAPFVLTIVILLFAEVTPKTYASVYPERIALPAAVVLKPLLFILWPLVKLINLTSNFIIRILGINEAQSDRNALNTEEMKTVVEEGGRSISPTYRKMLLNILDLDQMTVEDIMIPRNEIEVIDLELDSKSLATHINNMTYTRAPVIQGDINNTVGILHLRHAINLYHSPTPLSASDIIKVSSDAYFIPEGTPLSTVFLNFQKEKQRIGLVVDEYGDIQGLVTLEDLLEEIVGEFTTDENEPENDYIQLPDGSYDIDGTALVRDLNKELGWNLPTEGPKTLSGVVVEALETLPEGPISVIISGIQFESTDIDQTRIKRLRAQMVTQSK